MKKITLGIVAHVDSGKTTLSEALLYRSGVLRSFGRVDKGESFLDTDSLERKRGITIYSKQAMLEYGDTSFTLLDTPGHADFSAEMERTLQVLDYALLLVSAPDGITGQGETLWKMLEDYEIPTFIFFNKMDQPGTDRKKLLAEAKARLSDGVVEFGKYINADSTCGEDLEEFYDQIAMTDEDAMEGFLENGSVSEEKILDLIADRKIFPCFFGSALKQEGIDEILGGLDRLTLETDYPEEFGARVFKITRDASGKRLTMLKVTGGVLKNKSSLPDGEEISKINQIRIYSGEKFESVQEAGAGDVCTVEGLKESFAGQGFGYESQQILPLLAPVLRYRVILPRENDPVLCVENFKTVEEESPELSVEWDEDNKEIYVRVMGEVQLEVLTSVMEERFGLKVTFDTGEVIYKETITAPTIGVGHFEPLRHYAEVHLLMEPLPEGSGLEFQTMASTDLLAKNWQRLILTHLEEREHKGVLTGSAITDMRITVVGGKASKNHTEGGDFRKATYRAVRQGLMMTKSRLLEPYYRFSLRVPSENVGRVMNDLDRMKAEFSAPDIRSETAAFSGRVPVASLSDYAKELAAFTQGKGSLNLVPCGFGPCHNPEEVIEAKGYDPERDVRNTPDSVFCAAGSGFIVPYDQVYEHMHVSFEQDGFAKDLLAGSGAAVLSDAVLKGFKKEKSGSVSEIYLGTEEVDKIISGISRSSGVDKHRTGWKRKRKKNSFGMADSAGVINSSMHGTGRSSNSKNGPGSTLGRAGTPVKTAIFQAENADYLLVDGYNVIFAWEDLNELARENMDAARITLMEKLCNWQALTGSQVICVFDAYRVKGHDTEISDYMNIHVVFTKEAETADQFIEKFAHEHGKKDKVAVVTSDGLEQIIIRGQGCALVSSREFKVKMESLFDSASRK